jgi:uncharacterized delta-60 repeat protein
MRLAALALLLAAPLALASGQPDPRFDGDGRRLVDAVPEALFDYATAGLLDRNGRHVAVGGASGVDSAPAVALRTRTDGQLDPGFGSSGIVRTPSPDPGRRAFEWVDVAEQPDGRLVLLGRASASLSARAFVCRMREDGSLDPTLGDEGCTALEFWFDSGNDAALALALQADGRILVLGATDFDVDPGLDYALIRLEADGTPDVCFGDASCQLGGVVIEPEPASDLPGLIWPSLALALAPDGGIVLSGTVDGEPRQMFAIRLLPSGAVDEGFGKGGHAFADFGADGVNAAAVEVDAQGAIFVVGSRIGAQDSLAVVAKLTPDGDLDPGFDGDGRVVLLFNDVAPDQDATALALQDDGKLLVAGTARVGDNSDCGIARLLPDGMPDPVFGFNGAISVDGGGADDPVGFDACRGLAARAGAVALFGAREVAFDDTDTLLLRLDQDDLFRDGFEAP